MKTLFIHLSSLNGVVLSSAAIRCFKNKFPEDEVHFLTDSQFRPAIEFNPAINKVQVLAHSWELMQEELRVEHYDRIIDLDNNAISGKIKQAFPKIKYYSIARHSFAGSLYSIIGIDTFPKSNQAEQYLSALGALEVRNDNRGLDYFISDKDQTTKEDIPASHHAGFIACVIADEGKKQWQLDKWKDFCASMDHPLILLGDKKDMNRAEEIKSFDPVKIYSACGKFSLNEMADLVNKAKVILTPGSWLMQVAAAYKRPIVWMHDAALPAHLVAPYYGENYLSSRPKSPYIQCKVNDDVKEITRNILSFL